MNSNGLHNAHERHGELKEDYDALEEDRDLLFTLLRHLGQQQT